MKSVARRHRRPWRTDQTNSAEFLWICCGIKPPLLPDKPITADSSVEPLHLQLQPRPAQSHRAHNEATPMTTRQTDIYRLDIGHGTSDTPPPRQTNVQQNGTAYIWHSTTQELLPILPPDHPDYRENSDYLLAAIRRWNGEAK